MQSENNPDGQKRSFIEEARRAQIIEAAVATIAEAGYPNASLARIARTAGISKGVISYHFDGKDELMDQVVTGVYTEIAETVAARVMAQADAEAMLRAHVRGVAEYALEHRDRMAALAQIFIHARDADGGPRFGGRKAEPLYQGLEAFYRHGQDSGEFRDFDVRVMAVSQQSSIDAMFEYWRVHPDHDLLAHADELGELLVRATRAD
ncbi:TetR/AcrR family transcriptional regulator [Nocardiopsis sp. L17-MgMaSL7]|uniref:TetR/AcrR family transcriptional regulator n=1 Tax=Nocardiopsis sp. L17-MgMaSL7 TaxID=1938893 RepID=UPI000D708E55|nr:TetR/AcrR family transcriptional regulator [Nocardiopsis sp. L17-MgMaSL7]PWV55006.1 TetR family transcriptional regulator [Nocardiopsis sp. L17-MgMaSL7]